MLTQPFLKAYIIKFLVPLASFKIKLLKKKKYDVRDIINTFMTLQTNVSIFKQNIKSIYEIYL